MAGADCRGLLGAEGGGKVEVEDGLLEERMAGRVGGEDEEGVAGVVVWEEAGEQVGRLAL